METQEDQHLDRLADEDAQAATQPAQPPLIEGRGVQIVYLHGPDVAHSFAESLRQAYAHDRGPQVLHPDPLPLRTTSGRLVQNRNIGVKLFLDHTDRDWLMWIDTDMGFPPDAIHHLLHTAIDLQAPIVGGLCFATYFQEADGANGYRSTIVPTMYRLGEKTSNQAQSFCFYGPYPADTPVQVAATGGAFILIHRTALEQVRAQYGEAWYKEAYDGDGDVIGEDLAFCARALAVGLPIWVDTGVKTTHQKPQWLGEPDYLLQQAVDMVDATSAEDGPANLPVAIDVVGSLASVSRNAHVQGGMLKHPDDLDRYRQILHATKPDIIIELGTNSGASAAWLAEVSGARIVTVDTDPDALREEFYQPGQVDYVHGSSTDPKTVAFVQDLVRDSGRIMVIADSDHSSQHVGEEIALYGPLVSEGCYLVVEDGIFGYAGQHLRDQHIPGQDGSPLTPISLLLAGNPAWARDVAVERLTPISHHPAGWWIRTAEEAA